MLAPYDVSIRVTLASWNKWKLPLIVSPLKQFPWKLSVPWPSGRTCSLRSSDQLFFMCRALTTVLVLLWLCFFRLSTFSMRIWGNLYFLDTLCLSYVTKYIHIYSPKSFKFSVYYYLLFVWPHFLNSLYQQRIIINVANIYSFF